jgi:uncharacterized protein (TIGR03086 family)
MVHADIGQHAHFDRHAEIDRLVALDRRVLAVAESAVAAVGSADLARPTPCASWSLGDLVRHMVANNNGWVVAARGLPADRVVWEDAELGTDPSDAFRESAARVAEAFADPALAGRRLDVYGYGTFSVPVALGMHLVDYLTHAWDVARAMGVAVDIDDELCDRALAIARRWPTDRPNTAFGVMVAVPDDGPAIDRLAGYLGRSPSWPAAVAT